MTPEQMQAHQYRSYAGPIESVRLLLPSCPADGALIEVRATGVCRSDWHAWRGHDPVPLPMVPGHEFAGVVSAVGSLVERFTVGDRVTAPFVIGCGECQECRAGQAQVCPQQRQPGFTYPGSFAEYVAVPAADFNLVELPEAIDFTVAAALGCRYATAYHALISQAALAAEEWLLVIGCGGVGLSAVQLGAALGARVLAVDPAAAARQRAADVGAVHTLASPDLAEITAITGKGAHVSLDAVGSANTSSAGIRALRRRGRHLQVGLMLADHAQAPLPWADVIAKELRILGCHGMAAADYPKLLALLGSGAVDLSPLVGRVAPLAAAGAELAALDTGVSASSGMVILQP